MTLVYEVTEADVVDLNLFTARTVPEVRNTVLKEQLFFSANAAGIVLVMSWVSGRGISVTSIAAALGLAVALFAFNRWRHPRAIRAAVAKSARAGQLAGVLGIHHLALAPDGVQERSSLGEGKLSWTAIQSVVATTGPIFLFLTDGKALIIPHRAFANEADKSAFMETADQFYSGAQGIANR
jgi:hypothetical protein